MSPPSPTLLAALILVAAVRAVELGLTAVNLRHAGRGRGAPPSLHGLLRHRPAELARRLAISNGRRALARGLAETALVLAWLASGALPRLERALAGAGLAGPHLLAAYLLVVLAPFALLGLPAGALALALPAAYAFHALVSAAGQAWWIWALGATLVLQLVLLGRWPERLAAWAAPQRPVSAGPLRERLEALVHAAGLDAAGVFVVEATPQARANATLRGLLRPQVLLDETLLARLPIEEVAAVAAHEIGHFRLRHRWQRLALRLAVTSGTLFALSRVLCWAPPYRDLGFTGPSLHAGLALAWLAGGALLGWVRPLEAALSRRQERAADAYAVRLHGRASALASALLHLSEQNLQNPWPHPWYAAWRFSHPPLDQRLLALARAAAAP